MKTIFQIGINACTTRGTQFLYNVYHIFIYAYVHTHTHIFYIRICVYVLILRHDRNPVVIVRLGINWRHCAINDADFLRGRAEGEKVHKHCNGYSPGESRDIRREKNSTEEKNLSAEQCIYETLTRWRLSPLFWAPVARDTELLL